LYPKFTEASAPTKSTIDLAPPSVNSISFSAAPSSEEFIVADAPSCLAIPSFSSSISTTIGFIP
jgi:hypothetical protein